MLNAEMITDAIRDGLNAQMERERQDKLRLIELAETAIAGWHHCAEKNDKEFELVLARLDSIKETIR